MRKRLSSRFSPWGPYLVILICGMPFIASGVALLRKGNIAGISFLVVGAGISVAFLISPKPKYIEFDAEHVYICGCGGSDRVSLRDIDTVRRTRTGFALLFSRHTRYGREVFFVLPVAETLAANYSYKDLWKEGPLKELVDAIAKSRGS
jgi:hypothetical protein